jgi:23S rRNA pseudouridine955/2504/2580 synthase
LNQKIKQHQIEKYYWTKVHGKLVPPQSELNAFLTKISDNFVRISNKPLNANSKKIITAYKVLSYANHISTVEVKLVTGRTHQIRAHFAFIGYPLVGEKKYTTSQYSKLHSKIHQDLTACKLVFNFEPSDSILDYLSHKVFKI